jgi:short-subunit dehydrogenase
MMRRTLEDMVVVITGASAGIGRALAEELSKHGAKLVLAARRLDRLEELNRSLGGAHLCLRCDVSRIEDCQSLVEQSIARYKRIDTLVCNAGYGIYRKIIDTGPEDVRRLFATNVLGTTDCIHFALPRMIGQQPRDGFRGQIMIVSSFVGRRGIPFIGVYSGTKAAQLGIAEALRVELRPFRVAVTSVHPIQTKTEFGTVATENGMMKIADAPMEQSAQTVARAMVRAIQRPRPEVWPSRPSRWAAGICTLFPRITDRAMNVYRKQVERQNQTSKTLGP